MTPTEQTEREEWINVFTHGIGVPLALVGLVALLSREPVGDHPAYLWAFLIYGLSMTWTYLTSTLYHAFWRARDRVRRLLHLLDHTAIYLYIAGTYTPIALLVLPSPWRWIILSAVWTIALIGVFFKLRYLGRFPKLSLALYLAMGWLIVIALKPLLAHAETGLLWWMLAGGISYSLGTIFFSWRRLPYSHGLWHLFVLGGSFCHFWGIFVYI
ncbi:MAG: hemolysin III family protein [Schleiferiaceae bacterium]|nr:hemolysin III family protein [Schleiferiaceae bacterium]MDR9442058.1 hemolysin III family protein [Schleiferiaceae bacterium]